MGWQSQLIELLTASLVRPLMLAAAAWLILRLYKVRHPASRHAVWTAVLVGMMLLPLATVFGPKWQVPLLPKKTASGAQVQTRLPDDFSDAEFSDARLNAAVSVKSSTTPAPQTLIVWCYLAGVLAMAVFRLTGWVLLWRVISRSRRLRACLRESRDVVTPVTVGVLRSSVILPLGWRGWNASTKRAVMAHEFAHVRRRDTLTSSLARAATCIYWFHPLAWWISRQMTELAESSCDAAALEKHGDPGDYSRILLGFAETVRSSGHRVSLPGLAIASGSGIGRRIDQVFELAGGNLRKLSRPGAVLLLRGVPVFCVAAVIALTTPPPPALRHAEGPVIVAQLQLPVPPPGQPARPAPIRSPRFEVASVRTCTGGQDAGGRGGGAGTISASSGRLYAECQTLATLIRFAYLSYRYGETESHRLVLQDFRGIPAWGNSERYTIEATGNGSESKEMILGPMLRTLLEDRFKLQTHRETKDIPVYELTVAKGGPRLQSAREGSCTPRDPNAPLVMPGPDVARVCGMVYRASDGRTIPGQSIAGFCRQLSAWLDRDVIDKTGLGGVFDIHLDMVDDLSVSAANQPESQLSSIFAEIPKLGLKLESGKGPGEFVVVDSVERASEN